MSRADIRVLVVGGRKLFREGLCLLLERQPRVRICGEAELASDLPRLLSAIPVEVVILCVVQSRHADSEIIRSILCQSPATRVIILALSPTIEYVRELLDAGAAACLTKEFAGAELSAAVEKVTSGGIYLNPALVERVVTRYAGGSRNLASERALSAREREVLGMIAAGQSAKEIAAMLSVSSRTIETHRRRIMEKLDRHSVAELTKYAILEGLTTLEASY